MYLLIVMFRVEVQNMTFYIFMIHDIISILGTNK